MLTHFKRACWCAVLRSVWLSVTPWTAAHQAPPSTGFPRQGYSSGLPFPSPGDLPDPGIEPRLLHLLHWQVDSFHCTTWAWALWNVWFSWTETDVPEVWREVNAGRSVATQRRSSWRTTWCSWENKWTGQMAICQLVITKHQPNVLAKEKPTYREVAESIYWWWPFLQLRCSVGHDIFKERLHGWLMEWLLLRWRSLLLHQQVWIKLTRLLHHLLLHAKRSTLKTTK